MDTIPIIERLQQEAGLTGDMIDGFWGGKSQESLVKSGKKLKYRDGKLKQHFGTLIQSQVDGFDAILDACNDFALCDVKLSGAMQTDAINPAYVAYMLATTWHETGIVKRINGKKRLLHTMQPVEEMGKGRGRPYGRKLNIHRKPYYGLNHIYYGRGYVQLTWIDNYAKMRERLGVDFVNNPELALDKRHAANIMIVGMLEGIFTGLALSDCIHYGLEFEFKNARRVINGTDKAQMIADYAIKFLDCLEIR